MNVRKTENVNGKLRHNRGGLHDVKFGAVSVKC